MLVCRSVSSFGIQKIVEGHWRGLNALKFDTHFLGSVYPQCLTFYLITSASLPNTSQGTWHYIKTLSSRNRHDARLRWCREPEQGTRGGCLGFIRGTYSGNYKVNQGCLHKNSTSKGCFWNGNFDMVAITTQDELASWSKGFHFLRLAILEHPSLKRFGPSNSASIRSTNHVNDWRWTKINKANPTKTIHNSISYPWYKGWPNTGWTSWLPATRPLPFTCLQSPWGTPGS